MTPRPASPATRRLAASMLTLGLVVAACGDASSSPAASVAAAGATLAPSAAPATPAPRTALPPIGDVPTYKADAKRTSRMPGPDIDDTPVIAWTRNVGCEVAERAAVIGDGTVVVGCNAARLFGLDARTGEIRWGVDTSGPVFGSAAIADGRVFIGTSGGDIEARSLADGTLLWSKDVEGGYNSVVVDGVLYMGTANGMLGLDVKDGTTRWSYDAGGQGGGTVVDGVAYLNVPGGQYVAVDLATNAVVGHAQVRSPATTSPVIGDGVFFGGAKEESDEPQGELYAMALPDLAITASIRTDPGHQVGPSALAGDTLLARSVDTGVIAFDAATLTQRWTAPEGGGYSPVTTTGAIAYTTNWDEASNTTELIALRVRDGAVRWRVPIEGEVRAAPVASGGMLFIGDSIGNMYALAEPDLAALIEPAATPSPTPDPTPAPVAALFGEPLGIINRDGALGLSMPNAMDVGPDGNVYLVSARTDEVIVLDPKGREVRRWGSKGSKDGQFEFQRDEEWGSSIGGVGVAPDGTVYICDSGNKRVQVFTAKGTHLASWGRFGSEDGQFLDPIDLDVDSKGNVYVVDDNRNDIQVFSPKGKYLKTIGGPGSDLGELRDTGPIHIDAEDRLYNADWGNGRIQAWDANGTPLWSFGTRGAGSGQFTDPSGVAIGPDGTVYAVDQQRVQAIRDGVVIGAWKAENNYLATAEVVSDELWVAAGWDTFIWRFPLEP